MANIVRIEYDKVIDDSLYNYQNATLLSLNVKPMNSLKNNIDQKYIIESPLIDNPTLEASSSFESLGDMMPRITSLLKNVQGITSTASGTRTMGDIINKLDAKRWTGTSPVTINTKIVLFSQVNPYYDVFMPMIDLMSMSILSYNKNGQVEIPGASLKNLQKYSDTLDLSSISNRGKLISLQIPGFVYLPLAMVERVVPTVSKQETESGYPLWAELDCTFTGLVSATTKIFENVIG